MADISDIISQTGTQLEAEALRQFGAAVQDQVRGTLGSIFGVDQGQDGTVSAQSAAAGVRPVGYNLTKYAANIASGAGGYNPKSKFLFRVKFTFVPEIAAELSKLNQANLDELNENLTFVVKQIDLPKVQMQYEDVNMYNFKTKILTNTDFRELNLSFYDDVSNQTLSFINTYFQLLTPITRSRYSLRTPLENYGFTFSTNLDAINTSLRGQLINNNTQILSEMIIEQFYYTFDKTATSPINAYKVNQFSFTNPRITNLDISDQDHEQGGVPNIVSVILNFDSINISLATPASQRISPGIKGADIFDGTFTGAPNISQDQAGRSNNPFIDIIAGQGQRAVKSTVQEILNKNLGTVAGGALSGATAEIAGTLGSIANRTIRNATAGISQAIAIPKIGPVSSDSASSSSQLANATRTSSNVS
jgi:hypothetical protein